MRRKRKVIATLAQTRAQIGQMGPMGRIGRSALDQFEKALRVGQRSCVGAGGVGGKRLIRASDVGGTEQLKAGAIPCEGKRVICSGVSDNNPSGYDFASGQNACGIIAGS